MRLGRGMTFDEKRGSPAEERRGKEGSKGGRVVVTTTRLVVEQCTFQLLDGLYVIGSSYEKGKGIATAVAGDGAVLVRLLESCTQVGSNAVPIKKRCGPSFLS